MLELTGRHRLGVEVADLLELQRALHGDGVVEAPADEVDVVCVDEPLGGLDDLLRGAEHVLHVSRQQMKSVRHDGGEIVVDRATSGADSQRQQVLPDEHGQIRLRRRHGDLGARPRVEHVVGVTRQRRADHVRDREQAGTALSGEPGGGERVRRLAGLADRHRERLLLVERGGVSHLVGVFHGRGKAQQPLEDLLADEACVIGRATRGHPDPLDLAGELVAEADILEPHGAVLVESARQGLGDHGRLLVDLLQHEVVVATLLGPLGVPIDVQDFAVDGLAFDGLDHRTAGIDDDQLAVFDDEKVAGVMEDRRDVGCEERLVLAEADDERAHPTHGDDAARLVG